MQDPQSYEDDAGNVYVRDGNRWRVIRAGQGQAPGAGPALPPNMVQMQTPAERRMAEERQYDRGRDEVRDQLTASREERAVAAAARQAEAAQRAADLAERTARGGTPEMRGRLMFGLPGATRAEYRLRSLEAGGVAPLNRDWGAAAVDAIPDFGLLNVAARVWGDEDYQAYDQAAASIEAALMPVFSGLAVTDSEARRFIRANQPRLGDSPSILAEKSRNRSEVLNIGALVLGRPMPFPDVGIYGTGDGSALSLIPESDRAEVMAAMEAQNQDTPDGGGVNGSARPGSGGDARPNVHRPENYYPDSAAAIAVRRPYTGPGSSPENPFVLRNVETGSEEDFAQRRAAMNLSRGMYVQQPDGSVGRMTGDAYTDENAGNDQGMGGVETRQRNLADQARAFTMGAAEQVPFLDEAAVGAAGLISGRGYSDVRDSYQAVQAIDNQTNRGYRIAGGLAGGAGTMVIPGGPLARGANVAQAARGAGVVGRLASFGARNAPRVAGGVATGALYGAGSGEGGLEERAGSALQGGALGGVLGPVAGAVVEPMLRAGGRIGRNVLDNSLDRFGRKFIPDAGVLAQRADARDALGLESTLVDVLDDSQRGVIQGLSSIQTPGRTAATAFADNRARNLPARTARIADEEISGVTPRPGTVGPPNVRESAQDIIERQRTARSDNASAIDSFGNDVVPLPPETSQAINSGFVLPHIRDAAARAEASTDPLVQASAPRLRALAEGRASATELTVREAQDISRALNESATAAYRNGSPDGPVLSGLARSVRNAARDNSDGYANWLRQYGEDSDLIEAATTGRNFISVNRDPMAARSTESFVRNAESASDAGSTIQRAASAEATRAASSNPSGARTVLGNFADDVDQARRATAIGADAARLSARARGELDSVANAESVRPSASPVLNRPGIGGLAMDVAGGARDLMRLNISGLMERFGRRLNSAGFPNDQAQALVEMAVDPARTREAIDMLATRMNRQDARSTLRAIRFSASRGAGEYAGDEE